MTLVMVLLAIGAPGIQTAPAPNPQTIHVFHDYWDIPSANWRRDTIRFAAEYEKLVEDFGRGALKPRVPLEQILVEIGRDKFRHPEIYRIIDQQYMRVNAAGPMARTERPPGVKKEHQANVLAWKYYVLRPYTPEQVDGFDKLARGVVGGADRADAATLLGVYGAFIASTKSQSELLGQHLDLLFSYFRGGIVAGLTPEDVRALLLIGAAWNQHHQGLSINDMGSFEEHIAKFLRPGRTSVSGVNWRAQWARIDPRALDPGQRSIYDRVQALVRSSNAP